MKICKRSHYDCCILFVVPLRLRQAYGGLWIIIGICISSCSIQKKVSRAAKETVLAAPSIKTAHIGITIYEPATGKYWYDYQGDKYFVPASNVKLPTCYAAMKYLGDSLAGVRYAVPEESALANTVVIQPTGDPTFLHPDFTKQPVFDFLRQKFVTENKTAGFYFTTPQFERWGSGWSWDDYMSEDMAERSVMPVFGNVIRVTLTPRDKRSHGNLFSTPSNYLTRLLNGSLKLMSASTGVEDGKVQILKKDISTNSFVILRDSSVFRNQSIPFVTDIAHTALEILSDTLKKNFTLASGTFQKNNYTWDCQGCGTNFITIKNWNTIHSQPTDSLLKPMMHRSDNFFAEQSLLMVSNERLGIMSDDKIIDTLLKTDFSDLPQKPRWVDGSGLSRYNLFTPRDMVTILNKMKNEFGMERVKLILPTGGEGTIRSYYVGESGYIFAKTGTLSGVVALSGFLYTKKNKLLIFSVLVNNHHATSTEVRKTVEKFLIGIRTKY